MYEAISADGMKRDLKCIQKWFQFTMFLQQNIKLGTDIKGGAIDPLWLLNPQMNLPIFH